MTNQPPTIKRMEEEFDKRWDWWGKEVFGNPSIPKHDIKSFFSSYLLEVLEYLKAKRKYLPRWIKNDKEFNEALLSKKIYEQLASELNNKIRKLKGENDKQNK